MKATFAMITLLGWLAAAAVFAEDWQPAGPASGRPTLRRPVALGVPTPDFSLAPDLAVRQASFAPTGIQQPIIRAKLDIPRVIQQRARGLMPVLQGDVVEAGPPQGETLPVMPKTFHKPIESSPPQIVETVPPNNGIVVYPEGAQPPEGAYPPDGVYSPEGVNPPEGAYPAVEGDDGTCCEPDMMGECDGSVFCEPCPSCCPQRPCFCLFDKWRQGFGCCNMGSNCCDSGSCGCNTCNTGCISMDCCNTCEQPCCECCVPVCCCDCYPRPHSWLGAEYIAYNFSKQNVPPLVTTSTNQADFGILGAPTTRVLYGPDQLNTIFNSGVRVMGGFWFRNNPCWGVDASGFIVGRSKTTTFSSNGDPLLARPFQFPNGVQTSDVVATTIPIGQPPQAVSGSVAVKATTLLYGFDTNLRRKLCCNCCGHLDLLVGYRQLHLDESIEIDDHELGAVDQINRDVVDRFRTRNMFNGGQIGLDGMYCLGGRWSLAGTVKVAIGNVRQTVSIDGTTRFSGGGINPALVGSGGILALNSNIGTTSQSRFAVAPEAQLKLMYQLSPKWSAYVGYNVLVISSVVRPGDQIDTVVDPTQIPSPGNLNPPAGTRPAVLFKSTPFVAQGVSIGLLASY